MRIEADWPEAARQVWSALTDNAAPHRTVAELGEYPVLEATDKIEKVIYHINGERQAFSFPRNKGSGVVLEGWWGQGMIDINIPLDADLSGKLLEITVLLSNLEGD